VICEIIANLQSFFGAEYSADCLQNSSVFYEMDINAVLRLTVTFPNAVVSEQPEHLKFLRICCRVA